MIGVIGSAEASKELYRTARWVGRLLAAAGAVVVTGGRGGVMEAASRGALAQGGITVGILPGNSPVDSPPNEFIQIPVFTGLGDARNAVIARTCGAVVALGGGFGTLSEIGLALKAGCPVIRLGSWVVTPPETIPAMEELLRDSATPREAVNLAVALASARGWASSGIDPLSDDPTPLENPQGEHRHRRPRKKRVPSQHVSTAQVAEDG